MQLFNRTSSINASILAGNGLYTCTLILCVLWFFPSWGQSEQVRKGKVPSWVEDIKPNLELSESEDNIATSFYYLLVDKQKSIERSDWFGHYVIKMLNNEGLQEMSDVTVNFDPVYQSLKFHKINIIREGKVIDKLSTDEIKVVQRETEMDRHLYDGTLTAIVNVTDMRVGDILEYSYTITGTNPILEGMYDAQFYLRFSLPIERLYGRLVVPKGRRVKVKLLNGGDPPEIVNSEYGKEYIWDQSRLTSMYTDINSPSWYDAYPSISVSEYKSWSSVIHMFNKHYSLDEDSRMKLKSQFSRLLSISDTDSFIVASIRFVQDEIRYLGFEDGSNSYKPEPPMKVLSQRYGDCKAKSFLLCEVLRSNGIKAWPMLVHSYKGPSLENHLPSPGLFDHCVVQISKGYKDYYIDPTISNQGGDLDHLYFPNYHFGLVLNPEEKGLRSLPDANHSNSVTTETFDLEPVGGGASLRVSTVYFGGDADYQRGMFAGSSLSTIQRDFVNFYSTLYPSIEVSRDIMIIDNRNGVNQFIVEESYWIDTLWEKSLEEKDLIYVEFYPLSLKNNLVVTQSPVRTMPYYVKYPLDVTHNTVVMLPESWNVTTESNTIRSDAFVYNYSVKYSGNDITIMHNYKTYTGHISAAAVENYIASHDEILGGLTYMISYTSIVEEDFELSWLAVFIALLTFCTGVYYAIKIYTNYDIPVAVAPTYGKSIGGWLILVAIGLTLSPIRLIIDLYNLPEYFDSSVWRALLNFDASIRYLFTAILMFIEMIYNFLYIPFLFLVLFLFYNRRSILPRFAIILYATTFGFLLIDTVAALSLNPEAYSDAETYETFKDVGRSFIAAIIWVPYFMYSERVQRTFVMKSSKNRKLDGEVTGVNVPPSIF